MLWYINIQQYWDHNLTDCIHLNEALRVGKLFIAIARLRALFCPSQEENGSDGYQDCSWSGFNDLRRDFGIFGTSTIHRKKRIKANESSGI